MTINTDKMRRDLRQCGNEVDKEIDQYYDGLVQKLMKQKQQTKQQLHDTLLNTNRESNNNAAGRNGVYTRRSIQHEGIERCTREEF